MSSVCNLAYIPSSENRGKQDLTYYQKQDLDAGSYTLNQEQLERLVYPSREELRFVESTSTLTEGNYLQFLRHRKNLLAKLIIDCLYK